MRKQFNEELDQLHNDMLEISLKIEKSLSHIIEVIENKDRQSYETINACEEAVDFLEHKIKTNCLRLIYSQQPIASDLRLVSAAMNMTTDMERISDQTQDIAVIAMAMKENQKVLKKTHIIEMIQKCIIMVKRGIDAFVKDDIALAESVIKQDDEIDRLFEVIRDELIRTISEDPAAGKESIDFIMVAKYLERIADHAVNIAEWVIFNLTGQHKNTPLL